MHPTIPQKAHILLFIKLFSIKFEFLKNDIQTQILCFSEEFRFLQQI
ncbi:hypothetical protein NEISICOT_01616 [Neisseria sicca ATCC 29256]|uniref:Uncharacterized protein n=1 Tax=Neisseria sicca ATCC 29256 TaxID=547045 RepID=C6M517_NEISI|nr:hypothetical protein NEISICOT_01616 [Neisseria sicca ATCC 29256]